MWYLFPVDCFFFSTLAVWDYLLFENTCYVDKRDKWQKQPIIYLIKACKTPWYDFKQYYTVMWWIKMIDFKLKQVTLRA